MQVWSERGGCVLGGLFARLPVGRAALVAEAIQCSQCAWLARLVAEHRPPLSPLVLVDGAYFSAGRLPRKKLAKLLTARGTALVPAVGGHAR